MPDQTTPTQQVTSSILPWLVAIAFPLIGLVYQVTSTRIDENKRRVDGIDLRLQAVERTADVSSNELRHINEKLDEVKRILERGLPEVRAAAPMSRAPSVARND